MSHVAGYLGGAILWPVFWLCLALVVLAAAQALWFRRWRWPRPVTRLLDVFSSLPNALILLIVIAAYIAVGSGVPAVRRAFELTEYEYFNQPHFYVLLLLFCTSLAVATIRRIPLTWARLGVWMVHAGMILLAAGAALYFGFKVEGQCRVWKATPAESFVLADTSTLYAFPGREREEGSQARLHGLPRYRQAGDLDIETPFTSLGDYRVRVVGYLPFAGWREEIVDGGMEANPAVRVALARGPAAGPSHWLLSEAESLAMHSVYWRSDLQPSAGPVPVDDANALLMRFVSQPDWLHSAASTQPDGDGTGRAVTDLGGRHVIVAEVRQGERWIRRIVPVVPPQEAGRSPVTQPAERPSRAATQPDAGAVYRIDGTGYSFTVHFATEAWTMATPAVRDYQTPVIAVKVTGPDPAGGTRTFLRMLPARFPSLALDLAGDAMSRSAADPNIRLRYIDATRDRVELWLGPDGSTVELLHVARGGKLSWHRLGEGRAIVLDASGGPLRLTLSRLLRRAMRQWSAYPLPEAERDLRHLPGESACRVEVTGPGGFRRAGWVAFNAFPAEPEGRLGPGAWSVGLPDLGLVVFAYGNATRPLPFVIRLTDFRVDFYPGTNRPRDYVSTVEISDPGGGPTRQTRSISLNAPAGVGPYRLSQASWDPQGRRFTVLGVGMRRGAWPMAVGTILMGLGMLWAFYVKPIILRRGKAERDE